MCRQYSSHSLVIDTLSLDVGLGQASVGNYFYFLGELFLVELFWNVALETLKKIDSLPQNPIDYGVGLLTYRE